MSHRTRLLLTAAVVAVLAILGVVPLWASGYILGVLTVAYYFSVFAMAWDLLFGFANEVNFGPTFLIGLGAYGAGILNGHGFPIWASVILGHADRGGRRHRAGTAGAAPDRPLFRPDHAGGRANPAEPGRGIRRVHRRARSA